MPIILALLLLFAFAAFAAAEEEITPVDPAPAAEEPAPADPAPAEAVPEDPVPAEDLPGEDTPPDEPVPATPADLPCPHEHTETIIYFYDSPAYTAVNEETHKVSGPAYEETRCLDCGAILAGGDVAYAEEIRPHSFKNSVCALCGYHLRVKETEAPTPAAIAEETLEASQDGMGVTTLTLTDADLRSLMDSGVSTVLIKEKQGHAAVALSVPKMQAQTQGTGMDLRLDLVEWDDGGVFAGLSLAQNGKKQRTPDRAGITLRFYQAKNPPLTFSLSRSDSDTLVEADGTWNDRGYWAVPWQAEGTYFPKQ